MDRAHRAERRELPRVSVGFAHQRRQARFGEPALYRAGRSALFFANRYRVNATDWANRYLDRYVISDAGPELPPGTGLLVWTLNVNSSRKINPSSSVR